jgi:tripartite-type tricarboxylate transporter receptor subunit TctC
MKISFLSQQKNDHMNIKKLTLRALVIIPLMTFSYFSFAQSYPVKPIKILVGFSPGGVPDIAARVIAQKLTDKWGQAVVVENKLGAGSNIAAQTLASSAADGYTLLSISSAHAIAPSIYSKLPFDPQKDFSGITLTSTGPAFVIVSPQLGVNSMSEFLALARSKPGQLNFASAGTGSGSHFAIELLKSQTNVDLVHIPFKGIPEALTETMAGRTHIFISPYATAVQLVKDGKAKAIAVTSTTRAQDFPDLPTVSESGVPGYKWIFWYAMLAPAKTPQPVLEKLHHEIASILKMNDVRQKFLPLGIDPVSNTPDEMDRLIGEEISSFKKLAQAAQIKPE